MGLIDRYDLFIFDWDGTLAEIKLMNRINERLNFIWLKKKERSRRQALYSARAMRKKELMEEKRTKEYKSVVDLLMLLANPQLQPDSIKTMKLLRERGKDIVLFTNGAYWRVAKEARNLGIIGYFDFLLSGQSIRYVKPNPLGINMIIRREHAKRRRTLYIGDMVDDVLAARLAGVDCAAVYSGFDTRKALESERPRYLLEDIRELYEYLRE